MFIHLFIQVPISSGRAADVLPVVHQHFKDNVLNITRYNAMKTN